MCWLQSRSFWVWVLESELLSPSSRVRNSEPELHSSRLTVWRPGNLFDRSIEHFDFLFVRGSDAWPLSGISTVPKVLLGRENILRNWFSAFKCSFVYIGFGHRWHLDQVTWCWKYSIGVSRSQSLSTREVSGTPNFTPREFAAGGLVNHFLAVCYQCAREMHIKRTFYCGK